MNLGMIANFKPLGGKGLPAAACALFLSTGACAQSYTIVSGSMEPTLKPGDRVALSKTDHSPDPGDIIVLRSSPSPGELFIFRVVALAGDEVQMLEGRLHLNGVAAGVELVREEPGAVTIQRETLPNGVSYEIKNSYDGPGDHTGVYVVPPDAYFVLGDHRDNASDSRFPVQSLGLGFVSASDVVGVINPPR